MFAKIFAALFLLIPVSVLAAEEAKNLSTFDVFLAPYFAPQYGSYKAGSVDKGTLGQLQYGARLGLKIGPVLLGGEFGGAYLVANSNQSGMSTADKDKYTTNSSGPSIQIGLNGGIMTDRWAFIATYLPALDYDAKTTDRERQASAKYKGSGFGAEIDYRVHNRLYFGLYASTREFKSYSSGALTDADLDPKWKSLTYGFTVSYLVSFSDFAKLPDLFKGM